ncbi:PAS domain S-box protein [bacterium]|nr:PAS domain S-box protein [bacterium]
MKHWPLRYQLWVLLFVVIVPLVGLLTQTALSEERASVQRVSEQNLRLAQLLGTTVETFVREQERYLAAIANRPATQLMDRATCDPILLEFPNLHPSYQRISVLDLNGNLICSSSPSLLSKTPSTIRMQLFEAFLQNSGGYLVGGLSVAPETGERLVDQIHPVYAPTGERIGAIAASLRIEQFGEIFENSLLPGDTVATLIHENGSILARSVENEQWKGINASELVVVQAAVKNKEGWVQGVGVSGVERLYGYSQVEGTPWYVYIGTSMDVVHASTQRLLLYNLAWGALLVGLGLAFALIIKRNIEQPIWALAETARAVARGETCRRAVVSGPAEIVEVAASFNSMLQTLTVTDRVLHESEDRFRRLLENSQDAMYRLDLRSLRYDYISPVISAIVGHSVEEIRSLSETDRAVLLHPQDRERVLAEFAQALTEVGTAHYLEYRCVHKNGDTVWIGDKFSVLYGEDGAPHFVVGAQRNITSQKIAAAELHAYEDRLRVIIEASPDLIVVVDEDGENLEILTNESYVLTMPLHKVKNKSLAELFSPDEVSLYKGIIQQTLLSNTPQTIEFPITTDEQVFWLEARSAQLKLTENGKRLLLFILRNATERKKIEEGLRKFTRAIEQSPASVVITNVDGVVEYVNPRFCQVTGYSADEVIGQNPRLVNSGYQSSEYYSDLWAQITDGHEWRGELCNCKKNGELFWEQASISPIKNERGVVTHYIAIKEDITERKRIEDQLRQQDRLAAVGQLAAGIAHDFNNIMSAIILYARMLQQQANLSGKDQTRLNIIHDQAQHAVNLIRQILDFSRRSLVERGAVDLVPFFNEMIKLWERTLPENIQVQFDYDANHYTVHADPTRLQQAMLNLALNARDAMPDGGLLTVSLQAEALVSGQIPPIQGMDPGDWLCITCQDSGSGIPSEALPHIFNPFFTTKDPGKGTGLGLAQVYGIVGQHDGFIDVNSASGTGATFRIYLPLQQETERTELSATMQAPRTGNELILLVEDNSISRDAIEDILDLQGYRVLTANNGVEALSIYRDRGDEIDLVLSDMIMPEMSGQHLYRAIKEVNPNLKMVLMTGYPLEEEGRKLLEQGLFAWLQKPFTIDALSDVLSTALDQPVEQSQPLQV